MREPQDWPKQAIISDTRVFLKDGIIVDLYIHVLLTVGVYRLCGANSGLCLKSLTAGKRQDAPAAIGKICLPVIARAYWGCWIG
jgi:hypothetical protein